MAFTTQSPDLGRPVPLFKNKFVMTVKATPPGQVRRLHAVLRASDGSQVANAYPVRDNGGAESRLWSFILDLGSHRVNTAQEYTLDVHRESGSGPSVRVIGPTKFRFGRLFPLANGPRKEIVQIIYPDSGTSHFRSGFTPYGIVDGSGEYVPPNGGKMSTDTAAYDTSDDGGTDIDGFWWLTFDEVAPASRPQNLIVESNQSNFDRSVNLTFS